MIKRELYMERIRPFIDAEPIKVITGIRRSGKSVMLELIRQEILQKGAAEDSLVSYNFEEMRNRPLCSGESLYEALRQRLAGIQGKAYLFFDEIQEVDEWERCINACRVEFDCDIYITGSNASLLSGDLATRLAGRYVAFTIYPFSYREFMEACREHGISRTPAEAFSDYVSTGGMPGVAGFVAEPQAAMQFLTDIYNSVVLNDIVERNGIRNVDLLKRIIAFVFDNIGRPFSATSIANYFKSEHRAVSTETVLNYINACVDAFLFYRAKRYDISGKRLLSVSEKYYAADHGMREALFGRNSGSIEQILENIVYMELLRRGYRVAVGILSSKEIDFVCERQGEKLYVQVSYLLASQDTVDREFGIYRGVADNYPKYVVSMDEFDLGRDGIRHCNIRDFLLMEEWR